MKISITSGAAIASSAAVLLLTGAISAPTTALADGHTAKGHCVGANACKGQGACKTATNACAGKNACKGTGFTSTTKEECDKIEGAKFEPTKS